MYRLPKELQVGIFGHLSFEDKLQFALTCHAWYANIASTVLYTKIRFQYAQTDSRTQDIIKYLKENGFGYQVLDLCMKEVDDPLVLSELFPNLKSFQVHGGLQGKHWNNKKNSFIVKNWRKLEYIKEPYLGFVEYTKDPRPGFIDYIQSHHSLTMMLLDSPLYVTSLTSLNLDLSACDEKTGLKFIEQLNHAPALENLTLQQASYLNYKNLDLLHENAPNLRHFELTYMNALFVDQIDSLDKFQSLPMSSSIASNLRTFRLSLDTCRAPIGFEKLEINNMHWIEYICRKYYNLTSLIIHSHSCFYLQKNIDMLEEYLISAFFNWTGLKTFDLRPIYLSRNILQAMDDCNICLDNLVAYCEKDSDMEQLINLSNSKQAMSVNKLSIIEDDTIDPLECNQVRSFLQSLDNTRCQLKNIDIETFITITPIDVLNYVPSLQSLSMFWFGKTNSVNANLNQQATLLTHLGLDANNLAAHLDLYANSTSDRPTWDCDTFAHIQKIIYSSPLLQSVSIIYYGSLDNVILDFKQNKRLKYIRHLPLGSGTTMKLVHNLQTLWYDPEEMTLERSPPDSDIMCDLTVYLPYNIRSFFIHDHECKF